MEGKKVLHLDRNSYYGGNCASINLSKLVEMFPEKSGFPLKDYGKDRDWNIDLIPKFLMADGDMVNVLVGTDVTKYLEFQQISGSFVYKKGSGICKVPSTDYEALTSNLIGFFEKRRLKTFFEFIKGLDCSNPMSWNKLNILSLSMRKIYHHFSLDDGTQDFIGHSLALYNDDSYKDDPAIDCISRIKLYMTSIMRFGKSPYIYPTYGLGELPQAFARLSAVHGGTYMLNQDIDEILYSDNCSVKGVRKNENVATCDFLIGDTSYVSKEMVKCVGKVVRAICLLNHAIPNTNGVDSSQIIVPQAQIGRKHDIYITCLSSDHKVCPPGYFIAMVSTIVESDQPFDEIIPGIKLLGPVVEKFHWISDLLEGDLGNDEEGIRKLYITKSYDSSSHFETICDDVKSIYERITGKALSTTCKELDNSDG